MKSLYLLSSLLLSISVFAQSSNNDETAIRTTVNALFDGMKKVDSAALKPLFTSTARLQTVVNKQGEVSVKDEPIAGFITSVGKAPAGALDERLSGMDIKIDGDLATAWTPYAFFYNGQQRHCGVNAFTLVRMGGSWKIHIIIDTRRKCD